LILGYSFAEIAEAEGIQSNQLRSMFSKRLKKLASQFAGEAMDIHLD
jgi:DNA-directed RNA polymerase specialized sigma24 family protein